MKNTEEFIVDQIVQSHAELWRQVDRLDYAIVQAMKAVRHVDHDAPRVQVPALIEAALQPIVDAVVSNTVDDLSRLKRLSEAAKLRLKDI